MQLRVCNEWVKQHTLGYQKENAKRTSYYRVTTLQDFVPHSQRRHSIDAVYHKSTVESRPLNPLPNPGG